MMAIYPAKYTETDPVAMAYLDQGVKTTDSPTHPKVSIDHLGEKTASHGIVADNDVVLLAGKKLIFNGA